MKKFKMLTIGFALCFLVGVSLVATGCGESSLELTQYDAVAATSTENGNIAYYQDTKSGKYYLDEEGKEEVEWSDIETTATYDSSELVWKVTTSNGETLVSTEEAGEEAWPHLISSVDDWKLFTTTDKTSEYYEAVTGGNHFKLAVDLDFTGSTEAYYIYMFNGSFDFNNHTVTLSDSVENDLSTLFYTIANGETEISNLNLDCGGANSGLSIYLYLNRGDITFSNITTDGNYYQESNNTTPYCDRVMGYGNDYTLTFEDCTNYATISATGSTSAGVFLGKVYEGSGYSYANVVFDTCENYGTLYHGNGYAGMLISNGCSFTYNNSLDYFTVTNCVNYGSIYGSTGAGLLCGTGFYNTDSNALSTSNSTVTGSSVQDYGFDGNLCNASYNGGEVGVCSTITIGTISTSTVENETTYDLENLVTAGSNSTYSIFFSFWITIYDEDGNKVSWGSYTLSVATGLTTLEDMDVYSWIVDDASNSDSALATKVVDGTTYYVLDSNTLSSWANMSSTATVKLSNITLMVYEYSEDGKISSIYSTACTAA